MDPNRNRTAVVFDALGVVVGTAVMGKPEDLPRLGDQLAATFRPDLTQSEINQFVANPKGPMSAVLLDRATTRTIYDVTGYLREQDPREPPQSSRHTRPRNTRKRSGSGRRPQDSGELLLFRRF